MIDDGRASCAFVDSTGCKVYEHRPGACRAYPLGRAVVRTRSRALQQHFVLLKENHCKGFAESQQQTPLSYSCDQGLEEYNIYNDAIATLIQHEQIRSNLFMPTDEQLRLYTLILYNLDLFRSILESGELGITTYPKELLHHDEKLLLFGIEYLKDCFFHSK
jgi:hypothetical protein